MDNSSAIAQIQESLGQVQARITREKHILFDLEGQERRLIVALEVLQGLSDPLKGLPDAGETAPSTITNTGLMGDVTVPITGVHAAGSVGNLNVAAGAAMSPMRPLILKKTTRHLVLEQFMLGDTLPRVEVLRRIGVTGENVNEQTVASTLSKLTAEGKLERVGNGYRMKEAAPSAEDTESGDDLA
jgi:hypothetical protein